MTISEFIYTKVFKPKPLKAAINWIIRVIIPVSVNVKGATIFINPKDPVISGALSLGVYENDEINFFIKAFERDMIFVDIGANVGLYTGLALSIKNFTGKILCLEPHTESQQYLAKTIAANRLNNDQNQVLVSSKAAWHSENEKQLFTNNDNKGDNRLYPDPLLKATETIQTISVDKLCDLNDIPAISFLKIDIQGAEYDAIKGAKTILSNSDDCIILSEFWPYGLKCNDHSASDYLQLLKSLGFKLYSLGKRGKLSLFNEALLIQNTQGRQYKNIVGLKGRFQKLI